MSQSNIFLYLIETPIRGDVALPLGGLTFAVKDNIALAGAPLSLGLHPPYRESSSESAEVVRRFEALGAVCRGTTNMDPLALGFRGENPAYGNVENALDARFVAGGSSAGSAVAVARGLADFAVGTDLGGSVRIPAAMNGVWGMRCSRGALPEKGTVLFDLELDALGILAARASTLGRVLNCITLDSSPELRRAYAVDPLAAPPPYVARYTEALRRLETRMPVDYLPSDSPFFRAPDMFPPLVARRALPFLTALRDEGHTLTEAAIALCVLAESLEPRHAELLEREAAETRSRIRDLIREDAIVLAPTLSADPPLRSDVEALRRRINSYLVPANAADLPALAAPLAPGIPGMSIHAMGPPGAERALLRLVEDLLATGECGGSCINVR